MANLPLCIYGTAWKEARTEDLTFLALKHGYKGIDTANQRKHYVEEGVGLALDRAYAELNLTREALFIQSKFTYQQGQDHRLPYDANADIHAQVRQSFTSSLLHLKTDYLDSLVLHGPFLSHTLHDNDCEVWREFEDLVAERKVKYLGVSNISLPQLVALYERVNIKPKFVQNRCFASTAWDREIRQFCFQREMVYQGFSLLTANYNDLNIMTINNIATKNGLTIPQVIFAFAHQIGILPLTGTSSEDHMKQDLQAMSAILCADDVEAIENIAFDKHGH